MRGLAERLAAEASVLAPDLRGRGGSRQLPGPYGLDAHVADLAALLDEVGTETVTVVGHSMGAAIATHLAIRHPERVSRLVLIDGGPLFPIPPGVSPEQATQALLGPSLARLSMTFPNRETYFEYWRPHPALADAWGPHVETFLDSDLIGEEPNLHSCVSEAAVQGDGADLLSNEILRDRFAEYTGPVLLIRAPRDLMNRPQPLISDDVVDQLRRGWPQLEDRIINDVNHYTILLSDAGIDQLAGATLEPENR
jgi:lipase